MVDHAAPTGLESFRVIDPGALPLAITFHAFSAKTKGRRTRAVNMARAALTLSSFESDLSALANLDGCRCRSDRDDCGGDDGDATGASCRDSRD